MSAADAEAARAPARSLEARAQAAELEGLSLRLVQEWLLGRSAVDDVVAASVKKAKTTSARPRRRSGLGLPLSPARRATRAAFAAQRRSSAQLLSPQSGALPERRQRVGGLASLFLSPKALKVLPESGDKAKFTLFKKVCQGDASDNSSSEDKDEEVAERCRLPLVARHVAWREQLVYLLTMELHNRAAGRYCGATPGAYFRAKARDVFRLIHESNCLAAKAGVEALRLELLGLKAKLESASQGMPQEQRQRREQALWRLYHLDDTRSRVVAEPVRTGRLPAEVLLDTQSGFWSPAKPAAGATGAGGGAEAAAGGGAAGKKELERSSALQLPALEQPRALASSASAPVLLGGAAADKKAAAAPPARLPDALERKVGPHAKAAEQGARAAKAHGLRAAGVVGREERVPDLDDAEQASAGLGLLLDPDGQRAHLRLRARRLAELQRLQRLAGQRDAPLLPTVQDRAAQARMADTRHGFSASPGAPPELARGAAGARSSVALCDVRPPVFDAQRLAEQPPAEKQQRGGAEDTESALGRYMRVCRASGVVPSPVALALVEEHRLVSRDEGLDDDSLCALASMVRRLERLELVDVTGSALLSDKAVAGFLSKLSGEPARSTLSQLTLRGCRGMGRASVETLGSLLADPKGLLGLVHLNVSAVPIAASSQLSLCRAIGRHPTLRRVSLAETGLGLNPNAQTCISALLYGRALEDLDIGWNAFNAEACNAIGVGVCSCRTLTSLSLASCCGSWTPGSESPMCYFLECLSRNRTLRFLDVSLNEMDYRGSLVLEDALEQHAALAELRVSRNPLGVSGMRSLLRLLSRDTSGLKRFECTSCQGRAESGKLFEPAFNLTNPAGRYDLDLSRPYPRAVLRMLYKACQRFHVEPNSAFVNVVYSKAGGDAYQHATQDRHRIWCVPSAGLLQMSFSMDAVLTNVFVASSPKHRGGGAPAFPSQLAAQFIGRYLDAVNLRIGWKKLVPLLSQWRVFVKSGQEADQQLVLDALSGDFTLSFPEIGQLAGAKANPEDILARLLHCAPTRLERLLAIGLAPKLSSYLGVYMRCQSILTCNLDNPTGHYRLDLASPADRAVATRLLILDRWEVMAARARGTCGDMSMLGNWTCIRNAFHQSQHIHSAAEWILPSSDVLSFDFVSWRRPPANASPCDTDAWDAALVAVSSSGSRSMDKAIALRVVSSEMYLRAGQLRELLGYFPEPAVRVEVAIMFALLLTDPQNAKIYRACMTARELNAIGCRLGLLATFPFCQPERCTFDVDLSIYEDRVVASMVLTLASRERPENVKRPCMKLPGGVDRPFEKGVPPNWTNMEALPTSGRLTFSYVCSPGDRNMAMRKQLAEKYGSWEHEVTEDRVAWWFALTEASEPALLFLYTVLHDFKDVFDCYKKIGPMEDGQVTYQDLKRAVHTFGWHKIEENSATVRAIFNFLDVDQNGTISSQEWGALAQLATELQLSLLEFLRLAYAAFEGDVDRAWDEMDQDGDGVVDRQEWGRAVQSLGFLGPSAPIFDFLVANNHGEEHPDAIAEQGWEKVRELWDKHEDLYHRLLYGRGDRGDNDS